MKTTVIALLATLSTGAAALAHEGPRIWLGNVAGQATTFASDNDLDPAEYTPGRLFTTSFVPIFGIFTTDFPGFEVRQFGGDVPEETTFGFEIAGPAMFFDAVNGIFVTVEERFGPPEPGPVPQLAVSLGAQIRVTSAGPVAGFDFFTFFEVGDHAHLSFTLLGNGSSASDGPSGVYLLPLRLTSDQLSTSAVFYLLLGKGVAQGSGLFNFAVSVARDSFLSCEGDLTGDSAVTLDDYVHLAAHLGTWSEAEPADGDLDGDGAVNLADVVVLQRLFGSGCP